MAENEGVEVRLHVTVTGSFEHGDARQLEMFVKHVVSGAQQQLLKYVTENLPPDFHVGWDALEA